MSEEPKENEPNITGDNRNDKGQFTLGQSGNPKGRPKGSLSVTEQIKKELEKYVGEGENKKTYLELLTKRIIRKAIVDGEDSMIKSIWAYVDGMPKQSIGLGIDDTISEVEIRIVKTKQDIKNNEKDINTINDSNIKENV